VLDDVAPILQRIHGPVLRSILTSRQLRSRELESKQWSENLAPVGQYPASHFAAQSTFGMGILEVPPIGNLGID
jgi:hypothetical protein